MLSPKESLNQRPPTFDFLKKMIVPLASLACNIIQISVVQTPSISRWTITQNVIDNYRIKQQ
jgi:hypothetical protein